jgi:regulator of protease activity HflC (stomatin/prohibitin superfamily)
MIKRNFVTFLAFMGCVLILLPLIFASWYTVDQGDKALVLRFGKVVETADPGFHFKIPFIDGIKRVSVRTQKMVNKLAVYSKDIQGAEVLLSINYAINPASVKDIYTNYGIDYENRIIMPQIMAKSKDVFGQYNAVEIVQSREKLTSRIAGELQTQFVETGIVIESAQVENIDFSNEYEKSVEERMKAEVEVAKVRQNLEREKLNADMLRAKAQGQADATVMAAKADADAIKLRGTAEADAIKAKSAALAQNPSYVLLIQAERWNGSLPQVMLPNGSMPILDIRQGQMPSGASATSRESTNALSVEVAETHLPLQELQEEKRGLKKVLPQRKPLPAR